MLVLTRRYILTTKELIYQKSLELFSEHGYSSFGMRDLAKHVGIRASSIYNHYKSKEDILLEIGHTLIAKMQQDVYPLFKQTHLPPRTFFENISLKTNEFFERDDINQLTSILIPEQFHSPTLRILLHAEFIIKPRTAFTYYFDSLIKKGLMKELDAKLAAKLYHSFFVYHFYEKYLSENPTGFLTKDIDLFKHHIKLFLDYVKL